MTLQPRVVSCSLCFSFQAIIRFSFIEKQQKLGHSEACEFCLVNGSGLYQSTVEFLCFCFLQCFCQSCTIKIETHIPSKPKVQKQLHIKYLSESDNQETVTYFRMTRQMLSLCSKHKGESIYFLPFPVLRAVVFKDHKLILVLSKGTNCLFVHYHKHISSCVRP